MTLFQVAVTLFWEYWDWAWWEGRVRLDQGLRWPSRARTPHCGESICL